MSDLGPNDERGLNLLKDAVYEVLHRNYEQLYICKTGRKVQKRLGEHRAEVRRKITQNEIVVDHGVGWRYSETYNQSPTARRGRP